MSHQECFVVVSDSGESWPLIGDTMNGAQHDKPDQDEENAENTILPQLLSQGWRVASVTAGSGSKDDTSYWLVCLAKSA